MIPHKKYPVVPHLQMLKHRFGLRSLAWQPTIVKDLSTSSVSAPHGGGSKWWIKAHISYLRVPLWACDKVPF